MGWFQRRKERKLAEQRKKEEARIAELEAKRRQEEEEAKAKLDAEEKARLAQEAEKQEAEKVVEKKAAPAKKAPAKKTTPAKKSVAKEEKVAQEAPVEEAATTDNKKAAGKSVYHVSKREEDGMWQIKYTGGRVLKLCKTKVEAMEYAKAMAERQEGTVIFHPSKGTNKGKFQKA